MNAFLEDLGWKDLLTLIGGLFSLFLSGIAYRRATVAEERAERQEKLSLSKDAYALANTIAEEKAQALAEIADLRTRWRTVLLLAKVHQMSETVFAPTPDDPLTLDMRVEEVLRSLDFRLPLIRNIDPWNTSPEARVAFREKVTSPLAQMSKTLSEAESAVQLYAGQIKLPKRDNSAA